MGIQEGVDTSLLLGMLSEDEQKAKKLYIEYMNKENEEIFLDIEEKDEQLDDKAAKELYKSMIQSIWINNGYCKDSTNSCRITHET